MSTKTGQIEWRRSQVISMRARGLSQTEIAHELQVSKQLISADMQYLRKQAKESIKEYATEFLPEQYQVCLSALDTILKHAYEILQEAYDNREKIQALELFKDTHLVKLELLSNATTIDHALEYIRSKQQQTQQHQKKGQDLDSTNEDEGHYSSSRTILGTTTTTGKQSVF